MKMRALGKTGLQVSPLMFGGNVFGWTIDEATSFALLDQFFEAGGNFIDTADVYSSWKPGNVGGESEIIIGKWMKSRKNRSQVVLATKLGMEMGPGLKGLSKSYILKAVDASLQRLQTDMIDVYQTHRDDADTPLAETLETLTALKKQGKVRAIGASNYTGARLQEALNVSRAHGFEEFQTMQPLYNLYNRKNYEQDLERICVDNNIAVINFYSLAAGFLTGKYRSAADTETTTRGKAGRIATYLNERGFRILSALDKVAAAHNSTPASVALAWLHARPSVTAPIASATTAVQLKELLKAFELKLSPADISLLNDASAGE